MKLIHLKRTVAASFALSYLLFTGCATYRVKPGVSEAEAILRINKLVNQSQAFALWNDSLTDSSGFMDFSFDKRGVRRKYSEIEDVEVQVNALGLVCLGFLDPTWCSQVKLTYRDATVGVIRRAPFYGTIWQYPPFYLFRPGWYEAHSAAKGFESMRQRSDRPGMGKGIGK